MSTFSASTVAAQAPAGQFATSGLIGALKGWWTAYLIWRLEQAAINSLNAMSDRELKDIGLTRSEIARAVRGEATHDSAFGRYW